MRKFRFTPEQLSSLTVPECFGLYVQAIIDQAEAENPHDHSLLPHFAEEAREKAERSVAIALAYDSMTIEQKLEMAKRLLRLKD